MKKYSRPEIYAHRFSAELRLDRSSGSTAESRARAAMNEAAGSNSVAAYIVREWNN